MLHILSHFILPLLVSITIFQSKWRYAYLIMMSTMLVDLDHLLTNPIYDPNRCSIGFHPLHQVKFIVFYFLLALLPKTRLVGIGLVIHMALDAMDCQ